MDACQVVAQLLRHPRQEVGIHGNADFLHPHEHRNERYLDFLHRSGRVLGVELLLKAGMKLPCHVRVGGGIVGGQFNRHVSHGYLTATGPNQVGQLGHLDAQLVERKLLEANAPSSEQGRRNHGVERDATYLDAVTLEDGHVVVGVVGNLRNDLALKQRAEGLEHIIHRKLPSLAVSDRDVPTCLRRGGER